MKRISSYRAIPWLLAGGIFPAVAHAQSDIEARLLQLEQHIRQAELQASSAQEKANSLEQQVMPDNQGAGGEGLTLINDPQKGTIKIYGDVEFNIDAASKKGQLSSIRTSIDSNVADNERRDLNGRLLIGMEGSRLAEGGNYAGFNVQPLADMSGKMNLDDAVFYFGRQQDWQYKIGRYEAWDVFPLLQDTLIEYSGNTASDLYADGFGYIYMMKEGRGRSNNGGSMQFNTRLNPWYLELNALIEDGSQIFSDGYYHGNALSKRKNTLYLRPVIAWQQRDFSLAGAVETNVISNAYGYTTETGKFEDQSNRLGYGISLRWDNILQDPDNLFTLTLSGARMQAKQETDLSLGASVMWQRWVAGYIYADNHISDLTAENLPASGYRRPVLTGKYQLHTLYTSWQLPELTGIDNLQTYLGLYYSRVDGDYQPHENRDKQRYGARLRFKYFF